MDVLVMHTPLRSPAHVRISARSSSSDYTAIPQENRSPTTSGLPASAYWTAYDHYMIEREARAYRRAYVWSFVATFARRLRQSIANFRPARA